jgi:alpha-beta hydrolase superfamily lysophospholipase
MKKSLLSFFLFLGFANFTLSAQEHFIRETSFLKINSNLLVHYGTYTPKHSAHQADLFYFHGFGDSFENHEELFEQFAEQGIRVISFDYPDHGRTLNSFKESLHFKKLEDVAKIGSTVYRTVQNKLEAAPLPLFLSGWSTGGLISTRIVQAKGFADFDQKIEGLLLFAPGLNVKLCVGEKLCEVTNQTLTKKKSLHQRNIKPNFPAKYLLFASSLLYQGHQAQKVSMPEIPTLVIHSSQDDQYVKTNKNIIYFKSKAAAKVKNISCPNAYHELDNETVASGSDEVRQSSVMFVTDLLSSTESKFELSACHQL